ncbi:hypothetical protein TorRG33x02_021360 [Trema orientale]|uniref:Uncharacterized protein n=1 Tax=Trema orientale TaxID=63057 RepID=A0A2P5FX33_TREOI|nr:hypothetical protein TorRG33x02_021360 [Trema orientale]
MTAIREQHKHTTGDCTDHRRQHLKKNLLLGLELRVETPNGVRVQQRQDRENGQREESVDKITEPEFVLGQVNGGAGVRRRPDSGGGDDPVVDVAVGIGVAVGEASEAAREAAKCDEDGV